MLCAVMTGAVHAAELGWPGRGGMSRRWMLAQQAMQGGRSPDSQLREHQELQPHVPRPCPPANKALTSENSSTAVRPSHRFFTLHLKSKK